MTPVYQLAVGRVASTQHHCNLALHIVAAATACQCFHAAHAVRAVDAARVGEAMHAIIGGTTALPSAPQRILMRLSRAVGGRATSLGTGSLVQPVVACCLSRCVVIGDGAPGGSRLARHTQRLRLCGAPTSRAEKHPYAT